MPENTKIRFEHFHDGNDVWTDDGRGKLVRVRGTALYATCAALVDLTTGNVIEEAWAYCTPRDVPSRKKGREISLGRLKKKLSKHVPKSSSVAHLL